MEVAVAGTTVGPGVNVGGSGVLVGVGVEVGCPGCSVGVTVGLGLGVLVGVDVAPGGTVAVGVGVGVVVQLGVGVAVQSGVADGVGVLVGTVWCSLLCRSVAQEPGPWANSAKAAKPTVRITASAIRESRLR